MFRVTTALKNNRWSLQARDWYWGPHRSTGVVGWNPDKTGGVFRPPYGLAAALAVVEAAQALRAIGVPFDEVL